MNDEQKKDMTPYFSRGQVVPALNSNYFLLGSKKYYTALL